MVLCREHIYRITTSVQVDIQKPFEAVERLLQILVGGGLFVSLFAPPSLLRAA
jgi:hypothetical protein